MSINRRSFVQRALIALGATGSAMPLRAGDAGMQPYLHGGSANGLTAWKDESGKALKEIEGG